MDLEAEKEKLLQRDAEWAALAYEGRDIERMLSYWTDDAIVLAPSQPAVSGKAALRQYVADCMKIPGFKITWKSTEVKLSPDAQLGYMFSRNVVTMDLPDGATRTMEGRAVTIWHREFDGEWRCAVDIWNEEPPANSSV
jgi:ketosteroid isomerase-like protein